LRAIAGREGGRSYVVRVRAGEVRCGRLSGGWFMLSRRSGGAGGLRTVEVRCRVSLMSPDRPDFSVAGDL
jgi:hypothetical protein